MVIMIPGLFYLLALVAVVGAASILAQKKTMYSALSAVVCFAAIAGIYFLLGAPFIGIIQLIIYAGAIMVLFLIVLMLLDPYTEAPLRIGHPVWGVLAVLLGGGLFWLLLKAVTGYRKPAGADMGAALDLNRNTQSLAAVLFQKYLLPFEVVSILVLVAIIGAVVLTKKRPS